MAVTPARYRLVALAGEGATSRVWQAQDLPSGSLVALKIAKSERYAALLAEEATRLLFADSRALARVLDAGRLPFALALGQKAAIEPGAPFLTLEWVEGRVLDPASAFADEPERTRLCLLVARDLAEALTDLHHVGSVHGDVKPANVVVSYQGARGAVNPCHLEADPSPGQPAVDSKAAAAESGAVPVSRFEGARLIDLGLCHNANRALVSGGTPRYLAPECLETGARTDGRARDLWALGITLAEIGSVEIARATEPAPMARCVRWPETLAEIINALLSPAPAARASAAWVRRRALLALGETESSDLLRERRRRTLRRAYLGLYRADVLAAARAAEVDLAVSGEPRRWLEDAIAIARRIAQLRRERPQGRVKLTEQGPLGRSRWLVRVVGRSAASWPLPAGMTDAELAERLLALAEQRDLETCTLPAVERGDDDRPGGAEEPVSIALRLGAGHTEAQLLETAERVAFSAPSPALGLALGRALRLSGELGRALAVLGKIAGAEAAVEAAETARRARAPALVSFWLERAEIANPDAAMRARIAAIRARLCLDQGDLAQARQLLEDVSETAFVLETRALVELAAGETTGSERTITRAQALAETEEEQARVTSVLASLAHSKGDAERALQAFRSAAGHAGRAGAALEEATYLTGVAAAAAVVGELGEALESATRATLLFEWLDRPAEAARAALSRASVYAQTGARQETREAAQEAITRARTVGDRRCQGYAHLALADLADAPDREALEHAERARALLGDSDPDDQLRIAARFLRLGSSLETLPIDERSRAACAALDARLEWWGARAAALARSAEPSGAELVLSELRALTSSLAPIGVRGPALAAGAMLAVRIGDGATARRFAQTVGGIARELLRRSPPELRSRLAARAWITSLKSPRESELAPEQIEDIDTLVRALGQRDRLRPLLDQVLDALVLWTGVERGLLLLRAPGERLVARAARNLRRSDLVGPQRELSHSLAERALELRQPVVAVDAMGELSSVHESVHALKLRSVLAVPLFSRGQALGVVYLDDRVRRGAFGARELAWVKLVATLASVAIADARDQILLRRAVRRAERTERRLAAELARREMELDVAARELARTKSGRQTRFTYETLIGESEPMNRMLRMVDRVTLADVPVLISGESGSGKELVARAIHQHGARARRPFVSENCSAIPEGLLESALFGHVRGAFTGAARPRAGLFDVADGGTLFLDEIGEMSPSMQTKLLRVLEDGEVKPVGSERGHRVNVRVIAATHRDLISMVETKAFRQDLYYRLNVIMIEVPALRQRPGDIELLVRHFLRKHAPERAVRLASQAVVALTHYHWPGNVRQLENEMRRALILADDIVDVGHLSPEVVASQPDGSNGAHGLNVRQRVDLLESELVARALGQTGGNQARAAELLGLSRFGLQKMMKRLGIDAAARGALAARSSSVEPSTSVQRLT